MTARLKCENECNDLAQAMVREGATLSDVLGTLRGAWEAEWYERRELMGKQFNGAQAGAVKPVHP